MLQAAKFQRLYILLRPCSKGGGGYARFEQARGKYTLTVNAHGFSPSEEGIRVLLAARDEGGGAAVCDLGPLPISPKGQSSLRREVSAAPGGLPLSDYSALCIARDWPNPELLLMGSLEERNPLSAYLIGETICRYLSVPAKSESAASLEEGAASQPVSAPVPPAIPQPAKEASEPVPAISITAAPQPSPAPSATVPVTPPALPVFPSALPVMADALPPNFPKEPFPFPSSGAEPPPKPVSVPAAARPDPPLPADEPPVEGLVPAVFTSAMERTVFPPDLPPAGPPPGRPPVTALPKLQWPASVKELENYFSTYPPFAPFDAPGWRFVQVPMAAGSTVPFYAVGMLARDGKVTQVAYAVPGERSALPPPGFSGYRWQQGRNGQGYWTLWKRA